MKKTDIDFMLTLANLMSKLEQENRVQNSFRKLQR